MQKPLALIFLSFTFLCLTVSCGQKVEPSGPDPVLAQKMIEKKADSNGSLDKQDNIKLVSIRDVFEKKDLALLPLKEVAEKRFYQSFKGQYKSEAPSIETMSLENRWFFHPAQDREQKLLFTFQLEAPEEMDWMTLELSSPFNTNKAAYATIPGPFRQITTAQIEASFNLKEKTPLAVKVYDYQLKGEKASFRQQRKKDLKYNFILRIEDLKAPRSFLIQAGLTLKEALRLTQTRFRADSKGMIDSINGLHNGNFRADINSYPDSTGFWRIVNAKGQNLSQRPVAGKTVIIKWITMKDLREKVAKKKRRQISGEGFEINVGINPERHYWQLNNLKVNYKRKEQVTQSRPGFFLKGWGPKECSYKTFTIAEKTEALSANKLRAIAAGQGGFYDKGSVLIKTGEKFVFPGRRFSLKTGFERGNCRGRVFRIERKKAIILPMGTKTFPGGDFYFYKAELVETLKL